MMTLFLLLAALVLLTGIVIWRLTSTLNAFERRLLNSLKKEFDPAMLTALLKGRALSEQEAAVFSTTCPGDTTLKTLATQVLKEPAEQAGRSQKADGTEMRHVQVCALCAIRLEAQWLLDHHGARFPQRFPSLRLLDKEAQQRYRLLQAVAGITNPRSSLFSSCAAAIAVLRNPPKPPKSRDTTKLRKNHKQQ